MIKSEKWTFVGPITSDHSNKMVTNEQLKSGTGRASWKENVG